MTIDLEASTIPTVVRGGDLVLPFQLPPQHPDTAEWFDLTDATEIEAQFPIANGSTLTKALTDNDVEVKDARFGKLEVSIPAAESNGLLTGLVSVEFHVTIGGKTTVVQAINALNIVSQIY